MKPADVVASFLRANPSGRVFVDKRHAVSIHARTGDPFLRVRCDGAERFASVQPRRVLEHAVALAERAGAPVFKLASDELGALVGNASRATSRATRRAPRKRKAPR